MSQVSWNGQKKNEKLLQLNEFWADMIIILYFVKQI